MPPKKHRGNPFRGVLDMMSEMNRISDTMGNLETGGATQRGYSDAWSPTTDIFARGSDLVIRSELPGIAPEDVEVTFSHGYLTIAGERPAEPGDVVYYAAERYRGAFRREITLPDGVDEDDIEAAFDEGLLELTVKGAADAQRPKLIAIKRRKRQRP
ncbi:Hsp20/alpha crystallin family protein [Nocardiopsis sp. CNT-189]|uniref:Hsp20/alpha crystallin family protein n=1 Tax=Nocardiopsis oceanisediminis TaxID=2816862 RepID=UPI003B31AB08